MYVTRPLSLSRRSPSALAVMPPEGPNSGVLVVEDEETEAQDTFCWGLWKDSRMYELPFPQNTVTKVRYSYTTGTADQRHTRTHRDDVLVVPVLGQPLSSNRYYVIRADGRYIGNTATCSNEEEMGTCCFWKYINDIQPMPFDHKDIYQQVEIVPRGGTFTARAVAPDGFPPQYLRSKGWRAYTSTSRKFYLGEANGVDTVLRRRLPDLNFQISAKQSPPVLVGKWYCPFIFIREGEWRLKDQMRRSMYYEMTLQQFWEEIYSFENPAGDEETVNFGVTVRREMSHLNGDEVVDNDDRVVVDGVMWFNPVNSAAKGLGLSLAVWERMMWEMDKGGWECGKEKVVRVERIENHGGRNGWKKFGCYVLVERFVLKRMDGSLAFTCDFKYTNKIKAKWE